MSTKVLVIGLDGVTFEVIRPLIQSGRLPNLARLVDKGTSGNLQSTMPPVSGPAWHAFKTGKNPGKTGVYDFVRHDHRRYQGCLIQLGQLTDPKLWDIIENCSDYRVGVYNLPTTYPPAKIKGFMVAGFPLPDEASDYTSPLELKAELDDLTGGHQVDIRHRSYKRHEDFLAEANALIDQGVKAYHYLKNKHGPDLFVFTFTSTDRVQHRMWKYLDPESDPATPEYAHYRELLYGFWHHLDAAIGEMLNDVGENAIVIVVSDHGFGPQCETFYINEWLRRQGYLKLKNITRQYTEFNPSSNKTRAVVRKVLRLIPLPKNLKQSVAGSLRQIFNIKSSYEVMLSQIDWSQTQAYSPTHTSVFGTVYINLNGREGQGIVSQHTYDPIREQIANGLQSLNDTLLGFKIKVFKREDLYHGQYLAQAPDLVYVINDFRCVSQSSLCNGPVFRAGSLGNNYSGTHRLNGIFIANGPSIKQGYCLKHAEIVDIVPTLLHILEIPIPDDIDGKVLMDIFETGSELAQRDVNLVSVAGSAQTESEPEKLLDESVRKRLKDLGYL